MQFGKVFNASIMSANFYRSDITLVLASKSPRRRELIEQLCLPFRVETIECEEIIPDEISYLDAAEFLAKLKANNYNHLQPNEVLITADTVVIHQNEILGKPKNKSEAIQFIKNLSNATHQVITGLCVRTVNKNQQVFTESFSATTQVSFKALSKQEIQFYVNQFQPYDKAGAYGIQEWIGKIGITSIQGDFYNVMGLPLQPLFEVLSTINTTD